MRQSRTWALPGFVLALLFMIVACATTPYTGRSQLILISPQQEIALGASAFQQIRAQEKVSQDPELQALVDRIGSRIAKVANMPDAQWEFVVFDDPKTVNAFALPGGKVGVYTGIFPVARTVGGLATIMSHEIAHVIARHGGERLSQGLLAQLGATAIQIGLAGRDPVVVQSVMTAYDLGANVGVLLPYSRLQESEADRIGILLMANAGYDPHEAVSVWERMAQEGGPRPPEFLSTHPTPAQRIEELKALLPNALTYYQPSPDQVNESTRLLPGVKGQDTS